MAKIHTPEPLPPPLATSEPGSFAQATVTRRMPQIIEDVLEDNDYPPEIQQSLGALAAEIAGQPMRPLAEPAPDQEYWQARWCAYAGRTWLDVPWYFAEAFFYRRLLEAVRYFQPGVWQGHDPFVAQKRRQIDGPGGALALSAALLAGLPEERRAAARELVYASLWGNRIDLSNREALARAGQWPAQASDILIDESPQLIDFLATEGPHERIDWLADNAGPEAAFDLLLADALMEWGWARQVRLHLKPYPFFVSDAMIEDVRELIARLEGEQEPRSRAAGQRLDSHLRAGTLQLVTHPFWAAAEGLDEMPAELREELGEANLVIIKGDANYRRLLGDRHWQPSARLAEITAYFPAPHAVLRTLKAEIIVGLAQGQAEQLAREEADWLLSGRRGVIHFVR